jgi:hypothetical protein
MFIICFKLHDVLIYYVIYVDVSLSLFDALIVLLFISMMSSGQCCYFVSLFIYDDG